MLARRLLVAVIGVNVGFGVEVILSNLTLIAQSIQLPAACLWPFQMLSSTFIVLPSGLYRLGFVVIGIAGTASQLTRYSLSRRTRWWLATVLIALCAFVGFFRVVQSLKALMPPAFIQTAQSCTTDAATLAPYQLSDMSQFVTIRDNRLWVEGAENAYRVRGVNYYPARFPWRRFLIEADLTTIERELNLLSGAGFNTLRLFLWNEALFACPQENAIPLEARFELLDKIIHAAAVRGFRLIVTLNDMPDLTDTPLYSNPLHTQMQTTFIVDRYKDEAAILAWDLRNEGDIDYGSTNLPTASFLRTDVLNWLAETAQQVRASDSRHLLTAGWLHDAASTAPYVDFVSFHHWEDGESLRRRLAEIRALTDKPLLLEEVGYSTLRFTPEEQRQTFEDVLSVAEMELAGWLIWTAFDFPLDATCTPPACPSQDNAEHHFGLWTADYAAKPAAEWILSAFAATP